MLYRKYGFYIKKIGQFGETGMSRRVKRCRGGVDGQKGHRNREEASESAWTIADCPADCAAGNKTLYRSSGYSLAGGDVIKRYAICCNGLPFRG